MAVLRERNLRMKIWVVIRENGDQFVLYKEPLGGLEAWAAGQTVKVLEFTFTRVAYEKKAK